MSGVWLCLRVVLMAAGLMGTAVSAAAQGSAPPVTALRAARLIVGDGTTVDDPVIVVRGDRVVAVGPRATTSIPPGARIIDLPGHTLLPGFIDAHVHLTSGDNDGGDMAVLRETAAHAGIYGVANARKTLDAGFTTVRDAGANYYAEVALRELIAKRVVPGPRIFASGPALGITGGHADVNGWSPTLMIPGTGIIVDGPDEVRKAVRTNVKYGADQVKIVATGGILSVGDAATASQFEDIELRTAVEEATRLGRKVMAHAHGADGLKAAIRAGVASIEHGSLIDDEGIALAKEKGTVIVPTLLILDEIVKRGAERGVPPYAIAKGRQVEPERRRRLRAAYAAGVKFALGTDATGDLHGRNGEEFQLMAEQLGAPPMEVIRMGTQYAAQLIGSEEIGVVATGHFADLVAVQGDPLRDLRVLAKPAFVMKGGAVVKSAALERSSTTR
ncbi:MAG: amidohydrolase family protein [Gemmatimonadaceae bacterium]|jgi:imidazolonepropionase-like amidohydrolase|nr:amidohydrolase family protein [Gemmatimonadaceae bacterium]